GRWLRRAQANEPDGVRVPHRQAGGHRQGRRPPAPSRRLSRTGSVAPRRPARTRGGKSSDRLGGEVESRVGCNHSVVLVAHVYDYRVIAFGAESLDDRHHAFLDRAQKFALAIASPRLQLGASPPQARRLTLALLARAGAV